MAFTVISSKYPPHIDPTKCPLAYGDRAIPRLNRELQDDTLLTRQRAVMALCDHLHDPEHIASAIREGIPMSLKALLKDSDDTLRMKSTECLFIMSGHAIGRQAFIDAELITPLSELFDDSEEVVRFNAHSAIELCTETPIGAMGVVEANLVEILVAKLKTEVDDIKDIILDTLHFCMIVTTANALRTDAMQVFVDLLQHEDNVIRSKAARNINDLSLSREGKDKAVEDQAMPRLVALLAEPVAAMRSCAAGAIMSIAVTTRGKYTAIECGAIHELVKLVNDTQSETRSYALKAITMLAEAPEGRKELLGHISRIKTRCADSVPAVAKAAEIAVKVITWKP